MLYIRTCCTCLIHTEALVLSRSEDFQLLRSIIAAFRSWRAPMSTATSVICYHYPCTDGIFAALAGHLHHQTNRKPVRFVPLKVYQAPTVDDLKLQGGEDVVYFVDYTGPAGYVQQVASHVKRVVVLDHHKTAAEQLADRSALPANVELDIDMNRSGATIARDYFKPAVDPKLELMFRYVEDGDLWRWQVPGSKEFYSGLSLLSLEYDANKNPGIFDTLVQLDPEELISKGKAELRRQEELIEAAVKQAFRMQLGGAAGQQAGWGQCLAVLVNDEMAKKRSQLGNRLSERSQELGLRPMGCVAYQEDVIGVGKVKLSFRSIGPEDTTVISQAYNGGGHLNASSCIIDEATFNTWRC